MQSMKTTAALLLACQTANAISLERVKQLSVRRGNNLFAMEAMINDRMEIQPQDEIIDAENGTITVVPGEIPVVPGPETVKEQTIIGGD
jgi:hypothetical protein